MLRAGQRAKRDPSAPAAHRERRHLRWLKGHGYAVQAIDHLRAQGFQPDSRSSARDPVDAVGENGDRARTVQTVEDLGLGDRVHLLGRRELRAGAPRVGRCRCPAARGLTEGELPTGGARGDGLDCPSSSPTSAASGEAVTDGVEGLRRRATRRRCAGGRAGAELRQADRGRAMGQAGRRRVVSDFALDVDRTIPRPLCACRRGRPRPGGRPTGAQPRAGTGAPRTRRPPELRVLSVGTLTWSRATSTRSMPSGG